MTVLVHVEEILSTSFKGPSTEVTMRTLEEIDQLKQSGFGRPQPQHGLKLLYWFATDCLTVDQNNVLQLCCYPGNGEYGFHVFENRYERYGGKLLPDGPIHYYLIGNLSKSRAYNLPQYVREHYTGNRDNSNKDRIVVAIYNTLFKAVYVTEHSDRSNFNKHATYQISKHLIMLIRGLNLDIFLWKAGYSPLQPDSFYPTPVNYPTYINIPQAQYLPSSTNSISTPAIMSSGNQVIDIESDLVSQMNSSAITNDTPTRPTGVLDAMKRCLCTIL